jgi:hypothetical protein
MKFVSNILPLVVITLNLLFGTSASAQTVLNDKDSRSLENIRTALNLSKEQSNAAEEIFVRYAAEIEKVESEKLALQRTSDDENLLQTQLLVLNQEIKDSREMRDLEIEAILNPLQLQIYQEKIKPQKPQVLHFGIHDRAKCGVCVR